MSTPEELAAVKATEEAANKAIDDEAARKAAEPNADRDALAELQVKHDTAQVAHDKALADSASKLAEMERRYNIAVKTGSKTPPQNTPSPSSPVGDWVTKTFGT